MIRFLDILRHPAFWAVATLAVMWPALQSWGDILTRAVWFHLTADEALHSEFIEVLAQTGKYQPWNGPVFAPHATTGPALILPAAILSWISGWPGAAMGRVVSFIYYLGTCILICKLVLKPLVGRPTFNRTLACLLALGIFHTQWRALRENFYYPYGVLGEQAMIFWLCASFFALMSKRSLRAGVACGLALLSKPYCIFIAPVFLITLCFQKDGRGVARFTAGLLIPWTGWLTWMAFVLGLNGTVQYWIQYPQVMKQANGGLAPATLPFSAVLAQIPRILNMKGIFFLIAGFFTVLLQARRQPWSRPLAVFAFIHLFWWAFAAPGPQPRYLVPAYLIFCLSSLSFLLERVFAWRQPPAWSPAIRATVLFFCVAAVSWRAIPEWMRISSDLPSYGFPQQLLVQQDWKKLQARHPDSLLTTQPEFGDDAALLLSAPFSVHRVPADELPRWLKPGAWFLFGENTPASASEYLRRAACQKMGGVQSGPIGIWAC